MKINKLKIKNLKLVNVPASNQWNHYFQDDVDGNIYCLSCPEFKEGTIYFGLTTDAIFENTEQFFDALYQIEESFILNKK